MRLACATLALAISAGASHAQSLTPVMGRVTTSQDMFQLRVKPRNTYSRRMRMEVRVYDAKFRPVRALISPWRFGIAAGSTRNVKIMVPFNGRAKRKVRVCVEAMPYSNTNQQIRTQVCGRYIATRR